jgi:nitronate monooxygenase
MAPTTPSPDAVTALRTALGIEVPLLGAPMARIAGGRLAAAVSEAGGLGFLGGGYGDLDWLDRELDAVDPAAVGVGLITWRLDGQPHVLDRVLERRPRAVWLSYGDPSPYTARVRRAGAAVACQVLDAAGATTALRAGADVLEVEPAAAVVRAIHRDALRAWA